MLFSRSLQRKICILSFLVLLNQEQEIQEFYSFICYSGNAKSIISFKEIGRRSEVYPELIFVVSVAIFLS